MTGARKSIQIAIQVFWKTDVLCMWKIDAREKDIPVIVYIRVCIALWA